MRSDGGVLSYILGSMMTKAPPPTLASLPPCAPPVQMEGAGLRGWPKSVGDLIEMCWVRKACNGPRFTDTCVDKTEGYGFIEVEISNSAISTVFHQPLKDGGGSSREGEREGGREGCGRPRKRTEPTNLGVLGF